MIKEETWLDEIIGNFNDTMNNIVYKLQTYINTYLSFMTDSSDVLESYKYNDDIVGFLVCESEEILKNKLLKTAVDITNSIDTKYENLVYQLNDHKECEYNIQKFIFSDYLAQYRGRCYRLSYKYSEEQYLSTDFYNIMDFFQNQCKSHLVNKDTCGIEQMDGKHMIVFLDIYYKILKEYVLKLRSFEENANDTYNAILVIRDMIDIFIVVYTGISTISIKE